MFSIATEVSSYEGYFHAIRARFDELEHRLESLIDKVVVEVNNEKREYQKTTLDKAYSTVCKAKMRQNWRSTQFRKIKLFFEGKGIKHVNDATMTHADEYANWITSIYDKPNTRRGFISAFKEFFHILESRKIIPFNISKHLETPKEQLHQSKTIEYHELEEMIDYAMKKYEKYQSQPKAMAYLFLLMLRDTSSRIAEIRRIKRSHIIKEERVIHIPIGKNRREYYKFYGYIDDQFPTLLEKIGKEAKGEYVFTQRNGKRYDVKGLRWIFYNIAQKLGIDANPNAVRSCMADWYDRNTNLSDEEIARQIGNEPQTLRRHYKKRKLETVKATVKKLNGTQQKLPKSIDLQRRFTQLVAQGLWSSEGETRR